MKCTVVNTTSFFNNRLPSIHKNKMKKLILLQYMLITVIRP